MSTPLHIVFAGGGTLGHLFPGLAVAAEIKRFVPTALISFAGCGKPGTAQHVHAAGFEHVPLSCRPRPAGFVDSLRFVAKNIRGFQQAIRYLRVERVDAVVGLGGYASYPMSRAAARCGVPLVLLEQNAIPGRATKHLAPLAQLICVAFEETRQHLSGNGPIRVTGNPVRHVPTEKVRSATGRLLVLGGSQGARALNLAVPKALAGPASQLSTWNILHQTGEADVAATAQLYRDSGIQAQVNPFINNLPRVMAHCQLAISRAGGTTLAELAVAGLPAVLVPYPGASDDHQRRNAQVFATQGGCRICDERDGRSLESRLAAELPQLLANPELRTAMTDQMRRLARPAAAWHVARMILDLASSAPNKRQAA